MHIGIDMSSPKDQDSTAKEEPIYNVDYDYEKASHEETSRGFFGDFIDSWKPPKHYDFDTTGLTTDQIAMTLIARSKPKLTKRHLKMISAAGCIGTGLFIGTGNNLMHGGPGALLVAAFAIGAAVLFTMAAMGELGVRYPIRSSFTMMPARWMDKSWAFALSWNYALCWMVVVPLEIIAAAITINFWHDDDNSAAKANPVAWVVIFYFFISAINLVGSRGYGEAEFIFGLIKVTAMLGFIIFGIVINCGGGPLKGYIGGKYWVDPGSFPNSFKGVAVVMVSMAFALGGTEVAGVSAAEVANPQRALPSAVKEIFWRIFVFFLVGLTMIGLLVPFNDPSLGTDGAGVSPFVLAIQNAKVHGLPSVFNAVIMISTFSVGNAAVFASSRTFVALATSGMAPKFMCYIDRNGRPLGAMIPVLIFGGLCFVVASDKYSEVFDWLYAFTSLSFLYAWATVCYCHIRHRHGMRRQGIPLSELIYKSPFGEIGSWLGVGICVLTFGLQFWTAIFPLKAKPNAETFFKAELSFPTVIVLYLGHKLYAKDPFMTPSRIDVTEDLREFDTEAFEAEKAAHEAKVNRNIFTKAWYFFC